MEKRERDIRFVETELIGISNHPELTVDPRLRSICNGIVRRLKQDNDAVIAICGTEGSGKSSLAITMGYLIDKHFNLEDNVVYNPKHKQIIEKITKLPKYSAIVLDEAIKVVYKRNWQQAPQILLNQVYAICRKENKASILCMPNFQDFDKFFREHRVSLWIEVISRGTAVIFKRDWSPFAVDKWWISESQKMIDKRTYMRKLHTFSIKERSELLRRARTYVDVIEFLELPKDIEDEYLEKNRGYQLEAMEDLKRGSVEQKAKDIVRRERHRLMPRLIKIVKYLDDTGMTQDKIGKIIGVNARVVSTLINTPLDKYKPKEEQLAIH